MNLQIEHGTTVGDAKGLRWHLVAAIGGMAVSAVVLAGIGAWQASAHVSAGGIRHASTAAVQQAVRPATAPYARGNAGEIYYLVGSQEQADSVRSALAVRDWGTAAKLVVQIVRSPEDEALLHKATDADWQATNEGSAGPQVYDMRNPEQR